MHMLIGFIGSSGGLSRDVADAQVDIPLERSAKLFVEQVGQRSPVPVINPLILRFGIVIALRTAAWVMLLWTPTGAKDM